MDPSFKTVGLIGKYNSPEIAGPLLNLGAYLSGRGPGLASRIPFGPGLSFGLFAVTLLA